jgi:phosphoenolpyruvate-protein phosphotransferase/dihydroxyacetone kinase phosphotransfer subunit
VVGIVIVSHSYRIAEGVAELAREMGGPDVRLETAGGLDTPEHPIGTDAVLVMAAVERAWSGDGVLVLMDLGSAVLSAEMALDLMPTETRAGVLLCEAPLVEGAVAAAVTAKMGGTLEAVAAEARGGLAGKTAHLGAPVPGSAAPQGVAPEGVGGSAITLRLTIRNPHGLHARPAARFVQTASGFEAKIEVRNLTSGRGPADASSLNAVATLGAAVGHEIEVAAGGPQAAEAIDAIRALAARDFDEVAEAAVVTAPAGGAGGALGTPVPVEGVVRGFVASPGIAIGAVRRCHVPPLEIDRDDADDPAAEDAALDAALAATIEAVRHQREAVAARAGETEAGIFDAHLLFLRDEALLAPARRAIHTDGRSAARAWGDAIDRTAAAWDGLEDEYLRARADDLRSVGAQVLARLLGVEPPHPRIDAVGVLVAAALTPADTAGLDPALVLGIATAHGGPTSHAAVLAGALGIPAVVGLGDAALELQEGSTVAVDGRSGELYVDPSPADVARLESEAAALAEARAIAREGAHGPAVTRDGVAAEVAANVGGPAEVPAAVEAGADGIGLFRTEFLFMGRDRMPDEDEQEAAYRAAAEALAGRPLLIRTLDAGADKPLPYLGQAHEENPFLGVRGVRLGLERPEILETQLRAILRVAADHPVRVMFPMVTTRDELRGAREVLDRARAAADAPLEVGIMIEVPAAALTAGALAAEVDFFSIGTNDLTQYTLAADRGNEHVAGLTDALHPAVLALIRTTVDGARLHGRWVGVCGELAGDAAAAPLLLGLGVRELSMSAPAIAAVKQAVRATDAGEAVALADRALDCATAGEVRALLAAPG